jgi:hypothetical protein
MPAEAAADDPRAQGSSILNLIALWRFSWSPLAA